MEIRNHGGRILHIDNALIHAGVEPNEVFLAKTETALRTLYSLDLDFRSYVTVSRVALRLKRFGLLPLVVLLFRIFKSLMRSNLSGASPSVLLFNLYKLGYYASLESKA